MTFHFSKPSLNRLHTCDVHLQELMMMALKVTPMDFTVLQGYRSLEEQRQLFSEGKTKIDGVGQLSNHNHTPDVRCAEIDVADIEACEIVIVFSETPRETNSRGGRHVELGMALALKKRIFVVGPVENVFMSLPQIQRVGTFRQLKHLL